MTNNLILILTLLLSLNIANAGADTSNLYLMLSKVYFDNFCFNIAYLIWTNFSILLAGIVFIIMSTFILHRSDTLLLKIVALLTFFLISTTLNSNFNMNFNLLNSSSLLNMTALNGLLINSINKYHPLFFYTSVIFIILIFFRSMVLRYDNLTLSNVNLLNLNRLSSTINVLILVTLYMGSVWAFQEGSWGGWWNWDPSETLGLIIMLMYTHMVHINKTFVFSAHLQSLIWATSVYLTYTLVQLNFELVAHNFGTFDSDQNSMLTYFAFLLTLTLLKLTYFSKHNYYFSLKLFGLKSPYKVNRAPANFLSLLVLIYILYSVVFSFKPLLINSMIKFFNFIILSYPSLIWESLLISTLSSLLILSSPLMNMAIILICSKVSLLSLKLVPLLYFTNKPTTSSVLHIILFIFLIDNVYYNQLTTLLWSTDCFDYLFCSNTVLCSSTIANSNTFFSLHDHTDSVLSSVLLKSTSADLYPITNTSKNFNYSQLLTLNSHMFFYNINSIFYNVSRLNTLFILFLITSLFFKKKYYLNNFNCYFPYYRISNTHLYNS